MADLDTLALMNAQLKKQGAMDSLQDLATYASQTGYRPEDPRVKLAREMSHRPQNPASTQSILDALAIGSTPIPIVGDIAGLAADANMYKTQPESRTLGNFALSSLGLLPFVPGAAGVMVKTFDDSPTLFHGTSKVFDKFDPKMARAEGGAIFFTDNPQQAKGYLSPMGFGYAEGGNIRPTKIKGNIKESGFQEMTEADALANDGERIDEYLDKIEAYNRGIDKNKRQYFEQEIQKAKREGYDGIVFRQTEDEATAGLRDQAADVYAVWSEENIKSIFE